MATTDGEASLPLYCPVKALPFELVQHTGIFFEEKLYTQALDLLLNILTTSTTTPTPVYVPSPQHLAVAATFLVHPSTTTRAKTAEEGEAPNAALRLLRLTNTLAGPVSAKLNVAFSFTHFESSRRGRRRRDDDVPDDDLKPLNLDLGKSASVWSRGEDFWHVVGWAFNCSVLHRERWARWQVWLEFMCEVLEDDWNERLRQSEDPQTPDDDGHLLKDSLIVRFILGGSAGYGRNRRILRSIFADGGTSSVNEFREVFHNELKKSKQNKENIKKREVQVNIDEEQYGDYLSEHDDDDDDGEDDHALEETDAKGAKSKSKRQPTRQTKRPRRGTRSKDADPDHDATTTTITTTPTHGDVDLLGGFSSLALRQRLLHLLSAVSQHQPKHTSFISLEELYHLFVENMRHLPIPIFQAFVSPSALPFFSAAAQTTLCEFLLFRMRESSAADSDEEYLNQLKLEQCFLPYAASTASIADNAKISIALEALLILLDDSDMLTVTPELRAAVQRGIVARAERAQAETKKSQSSRRAEDIELCWLVESAERLVFLVDEVFPLLDAK